MEEEEADELEEEEDEELEEVKEISLPRLSPSSPSTTSFSLSFLCISLTSVGELCELRIGYRRLPYTTEPAAADPLPPMGPTQRLLTSL